MQFAIIAVKRNDICSVLVTGDIDDLNVIYDNICNEYSEDKLKLIEYDEQSYNEIKNSALEVHKALDEYFVETKLSYDFLAKRD